MLSPASPCSLAQAAPLGPAASELRAKHINEGCQQRKSKPGPSLAAGSCQGLVAPLPPLGQGRRLVQESRGVKGQELEAFLHSAAALQLLAKPRSSLAILREARATLHCQAGALSVLSLPCGGASALPLKAHPAQSLLSAPNVCHAPTRQAAQCWLLSWCFAASHSCQRSQGQGRHGNDGDSCELKA